VAGVSGLSIAAIRRSLLGGRVIDFQAVDVEDRDRVVRGPFSAVEHDDSGFELILTGAVSDLVVDLEVIVAAKVKLGAHLQESLVEFSLALARVGEALG
jgi:hypothetical protein